MWTKGFSNKQNNKNNYENLTQAVSNDLNKITCKKALV